MRKHCLTHQSFSLPAFVPFNKDHFRSKS
uniref:Uncharacterized protein n=1 Tax=Rhizophora mucronata TaxID=61149 RepID=A0A2P2M3W0_RHIMU